MTKINILSGATAKEKKQHQGIVNKLLDTPIVFSETIFALAYFDFDIYSPTFETLQQIKGHLTKGSVVAFNELNCAEFPGETLAFKEVFGLDRYAIKRSPLNPLISYIVVD